MKKTLIALYLIVTILMADIISNQHLKPIFQYQADKKEI